jgi:hypothetical protein
LESFYLDSGSTGGSQPVLTFSSLTNSFQLLNIKQTLF